MSEDTQIAEAVEELEEAVLELVEVEEGEGLLGHVLQPNATRDYPNGGAITVRNNSTQAGSYRYRLGANGQWTNRTIQPHNLQGYAAHTAFYVRNSGPVALDVTP
jgi:hypothetical protein